MTIVLKTDGHLFVCRAPTFSQCQVEIGMMIFLADVENKVFDEFIMMTWRIAQNLSSEPSEDAVLTLERKVAK